ncbi:MAG TPA: methyltransferase domain-containing protein [Methylovirgula sp.]|nr:methyltransferase domain-containing protein [Methylovirgula sp.]
MAPLNNLQPAFRSSGDLIADRRFNYACSYARAGEFQAAAELLEQAIDRAPTWPVGWFALRRAREAAACRQAAIAAFARAAALDPSGELGACLHLARLGGASAPAIAPESYVKRLFDQYAEDFDTHLVDKLCYHAPGLLADAVGRLRPKRAAHVVDLGCGTGLSGAAFRAGTASLTGVDLSPRMIEAARAKRLYDRLVVQSLGDFLAAEPAASADLLLAADVLVYVGDLDPVFRLARRVLRRSGIFAFTLQSAECGFCLGEDLRYAHAPAYVREVAERHGFTTAAMAAAASRRDAGVEVPGLVVVLDG